MRGNGRQLHGSAPCLRPMVPCIRTAKVAIQPENAQESGSSFSLTAAPRLAADLTPDDVLGGHFQPVMARTQDPCQDMRR